MAIKISGTTIINDSRNFLDTSGNTRLQLLTGGIDIEGGIAEQISSSNTSGTVSLNPATLGTIPYIGTTGSITFTDGLDSGESILLIIQVLNAAHTITWPTSNWNWIGTGGSAPTLALNTLEIIALVKHNATVFAAYAGGNT